ncbi:hypothetical protein ALCH109712_07900 [Alkalicoccus chagannorensis]
MEKGKFANGGLVWYKEGTDIEPPRWGSCAAAERDTVSTLIHLIQMMLAEGSSGRAAAAPLFSSFFRGRSFFAWRKRHITRGVHQNEIQ